MTTAPHVLRHADAPLVFDKLRFDRARKRPRGLKGAELSSAPLRLCVTADDENLPKRLLGRPRRND